MDWPVESGRAHGACNFHLVAMWRGLRDRSRGSLAASVHTSLALWASPPAGQNTELSVEPRSLSMNKIFPWLCPEDLNRISATGNTYAKIGSVAKKSPEAQQGTEERQGQGTRHKGDGSLFPAVCVCVCVSAGKAPQGCMMEATPVNKQISCQNSSPSSAPWQFGLACVCWTEWMITMHTSSKQQYPNR